MGFKVGDRVRCRGHRRIEDGEEGNVCTFDKHFCTIGVRWDKFTNGRHSCDASCEVGHGWYLADNFLTKVDDGMWAKKCAEADKVLYEVEV